MGTRLDPFIHEHDTAEEADSYDRWYRAKISRALKNRGGPLTDHDDVFEELHKTIDSDEGERD